MVPPVMPAPTTVTLRRISDLPFGCLVWATGAWTGGGPASNLQPPTSRSSHRLQLFDDGVRDLRGAHGRRVVRRGLHVVGHPLPLGDDGGQGGLQAVAGLHLADVAEHHHAGEHHRHRVHLVHAGVLGGAAVDRLEHRYVVAQVRAGGAPQPADQPRTEVGQDVAVEVGQDQHVVQLRLLHQLHRHVIHQPLLVGDIGILFGDAAGDGEEEAVRELHDVVLGHRRHRLAPEPPRVLEGEADDALAAELRDDLEGEAGVLPDPAQAGGVRDLRDLRDRRVALLELDARVEVLGVLPHDHEIDVLVAGAHARVVLGGAQAGVEVQHLAQGDVDGAEAAAARRRDRTLDGDLVPADRLQDFVGGDGAVLLGGADAGLPDVPVELDAGGLEDADCGFGDLGAGAVARYEGDAMGHAVFFSLGRGWPRI